MRISEKILREFVTSSAIGSTELDDLSARSHFAVLAAVQQTRQKEKDHEYEQVAGQPDRIGGDRRIGERRVGATAGWRTGRWSAEF